MKKKPKLERRIRASGKKAATQVLKEFLSSGKPAKSWGEILREYPANLAAEVAAKRQRKP